VEAVLYGDENYSYWLTDDGFTVVEKDGGFELGHKPEFPVNEEDQTAEVRGLHKIGSVETAPLKPVGRKYVPLLLVEFQDLSFSLCETAEKTQEYYDLYCNGTRDGNYYTGHGSYGSIKDYFLEQSQGQFDPEFVVIGPVKLDSVYAYYGKGKSDVNFNVFRNEAIKKATEINSDWSQFDNDGNGSVDMIYFLYAGLGANNGGDENTIWPKESTSSVTINGLRFATSAACCELQPKRRDGDGNVLATMADGIGVFVHELSHAMGLPDFYDTVGTSFGMDIWSIMDYGVYAQNGYRPVNYTAYERDFMGWETLTTIDEPTTLHIPCFAEGGGGYKVVNDQNASEYYILENRQAMGWDGAFSRIGHGMQVTHVDYSRSCWSTNTVNTTASHQRMTIIAANNSYAGSYVATTSEEYFATLGGQLYPGTLDMHELTDDTTPASQVFTGGYMRKPIVDIQEVDGIITLKFRPRGTLAKAANLAPTEMVSSGFTATWDEVQYAQYYNVELWNGDELIAREDSVESRSLVFEDLEDGDAYCFAIQPLADDYLNGDWSYSDVFRISATGIIALPQSETTVRVYNTGGSFISECFADEVHRLGLRSGIYILRPTNGSDPVKMFIK